MVTKTEVVNAVLREIKSDTHRTKQLVEREYNKLKKTLADEDLVWAIIEILTS